MLNLIFWLVVLALLAGSVYFWQEERRVRRQEQTLVDEVMAYLSKRFGGGR